MWGLHGSCFQGSASFSSTLNGLLGESIHLRLHWFCILESHAGILGIIMGCREVKWSNGFHHIILSYRLHLLRRVLWPCCLDFVTLWFICSLFFSFLFYQPQRFVCDCFKKHPPHCTRKALFPTLTLKFQYGLLFLMGQTYFFSLEILHGDNK